MWLTILKYAAKIALLFNLDGKAKAWVGDKIEGAARKAEDKASVYLRKVEEKVDDVVKELGK